MYRLSGSGMDETHSVSVEVEEGSTICLVKRTYLDAIHEELLSIVDES